MDIFEYYLVNNGEKTTKEIAEVFKTSMRSVHNQITKGLKERISIPEREVIPDDIEDGLDFNIENEIDAEYWAVYDWDDENWNIQIVSRLGDLKHKFN